MKAYNMIGTKMQANTYSSFMIYGKLRLNFLKRIAVRAGGNLLGIKFLNLLMIIFFKLKDFLEPNIMENLDCILIMHGGRISYEQDFLIWQAKVNSVTTISIQENWDNLSSKTILFQHPDYFATWGKQSSHHLKTIHNYRGNTREIGSIRFIDFHNFRNKFLSVNTTEHEVSVNTSQSRRILIIGSGDGEHDLIITQEIIKLINLHKKLLNSKFNIIYRPHPYSAKIEKNCFDISKLNDVEIDIPSKNENDKHRLELVMQSDLLVSLYSTMILESCILNKPCLIPSFLNLNWKYSTSKFLDQAEHYLGISNFESIFNVKSYDEVIKILMLIDKSYLNPINDENLLNWYCANLNPISELINLINSV